MTLNYNIGQTVFILFPVDLGEVIIVDYVLVQKNGIEEYYYVVKFADCDVEVLARPGSLFASKEYRLKSL